MKEKTMENGMDLLVSFDTTGSMYPVLSQVRQQVAKFVDDMFNSINDLRVGIIAHGDYCDANKPYTIRVLDFTKDKEKIQDFIKTTDRTYGGDADECYELVLNTARVNVGWEAGRRKVFMLIGDAAPHGVDYYGNTKHLDWVNEAGLLNDMNVQIFAVHALSRYRMSSRKFYETLATKTNGKYLTLDQFDEVVDLIKATCMSEYSEEKLDEFISIIRSKGKMTRTMSENIYRLSNGKYKMETKPVQKDGLIPVDPGRFQVMTVTENCPIKAFVEDNGIEFKRGRGFYELTKHETVQQYKEVIIQDRTTGEMFTGAQVRERLGLQPQVEKGGVHESLSSRDTAMFRVFVQSTSFNRKLIAGTTFLYEVSDLADTGTVVEVKAEEPKTTETKAEKAKTEAEKVKTEAPKVTKKVVKKTTKAAKTEEAKVEEAKAPKVTKKAVKKTTKAAKTEEAKVEEAKAPKVEEDKAPKVEEAKVEEAKVEEAKAPKTAKKSTKKVTEAKKSKDTKKETKKTPDKTSVKRPKHEIDVRVPDKRTVKKYYNAVISNLDAAMHEESDLFAMADYLGTAKTYMDKLQKYIDKFH